MNLTDQQIEWIISEVIRRLRQLESNERAALSSGTPDNAAELRLNDKIVTLRSIENRLNGISRLLVAPRTILTPAVKDELKARKIELITENRR